MFVPQATGQLSYILLPFPAALPLPRLSYPPGCMSDVSAVCMCKCYQAPSYLVSQADKRRVEMIWSGLVGVPSPPGTALVLGPNSPFFVVKHEVGNLQ